MDSLANSSLVFRAVQVLFALVSMGLLAKLLSSYLEGPPIVGYSLFAVLTGLVTGAFALAVMGQLPAQQAQPSPPGQNPRRIGATAVRILILCDFGTGIILLPDAIAMAVLVKPYSCSDQSQICENSIMLCSSTLCRVAQAACAFIWLTLAAMVFSLVCAMGSFHGWSDEQWFQPVTQSFKRGGRFKRGNNTQGIQSSQPQMTHQNSTAPDTQPRAGGPAASAPVDTPDDDAENENAWWKLGGLFQSKNTRPGAGGVVREEAA